MLAKIIPCFLIKGTDLGGGAELIGDIFPCAGADLYLRQPFGIEQIATVGHGGRAAAKQSESQDKKAKGAGHHDSGSAVVEGIWSNIHDAVYLSIYTHRSSRVGGHMILKKIWQFLSPPVADADIVQLYRAIVAQARQPVFYAEYGVEDSVDGRFDLLLLHVILVMQRLDAAPDDRQQLFDMLFADMDRSLREMGVGDMGISKKIKPMIAAYYGRAKTYQDALAASSSELAEALRRNLYRKANPTEAQIMAMADYVRHAHEVLATQDVADVRAGRVRFGDVA